MSLFNSRSDLVFNALNLSMAIVEFGLEGEIKRANTNFCDLMGYKAEEIIGKNHSMFVDAEYARSTSYKAFWDQLRSGTFECREFKWQHKDGSDIYIRGNYNPIKTPRGKVTKVMTFANDISATKLGAIDSKAKLNAISRAQAVIEFTPDGKILTANQNFLTALGYRLEEIVGQHHRIFVDAAFASTAEYTRLWDRLRAGEFVVDEFRRRSKSGKDVFIQASYNPVIGDDGKILKVVKFATDVTGRVNNVEELAGGLTDLAKGDLSRRITTPFIPSLERLRDDFNAASSKLMDAMATVSTNAKAISAGSNEIRTSADDLAKRTEQQAASVEETAAALEEITTTVKDSSHRAEEAGKLVARAKSHAEHSGEVVREAIDAMGQIEHSSGEISSIIGVIDEIAFQTNLLALNAGVEAARAGEAGKGFAVVAQEVRELAQRSAKAAKEIKALITASGTQVANGVALVSKAGGALREIAGQVEEVNTDIIAIIEASREQSVALSEINRAINTVDQGTQQNAAMVEEQTAASHTLAQEASELFDLLGQFQFGDRPTSTPTVRIASIKSASPSMPRQIERAPAAKARGSAAVAAQADWEEF